MRRFAALVFLMSLVPAVALGQGAADEDKAKARELAQKAADQLDEKQYEEALATATAAEGLYHAPYHVFVIASAQEGLGRLTEAATTYERLVAEPLPSSAPQVFREAQETGKTRLRELLARIPTVLLRVRGAAAENVTAMLDNETLDLVSGVATRANPGDHVVRVNADGYAPFEKTITLPNKGGVVVVEATLTKAANPQSGGSEIVKMPEQGAGNGGGGKTESSKVPAYVALGLGGAGLVVGSVAGVLELGKVSTLKEKCPNYACGPDQASEISSAEMLAKVSNVGFVVAGVGAATGMILLFVGKKPEPKKTGITWTPWIGPQSAGVFGSF